MDKPWQGMMHLGVIHFMMFPEVMRDESRVVETARKIAEDSFFGVIEIARIENDGVREELKAVLEEGGVEVEMAAQPKLLGGKLNLASLDENARHAAVDDVKKTIDQAYYFRSTLVATLDGANSYPGPENEARATEQLIKSLGELCEYAEDTCSEQPLTLSLETFDRSVDKKSLVGPSTLAVQVASAVKQDHPFFGLTIDLSHLPLLGESPAKALQTTKNYLVHAHVGNCAFRDRAHPAFGDNHPRFGAPGGENGVRELAEFLQELIKIGYFDKQLPTRMPVVSFEVKPMPGESPELLIANCKRFFQEAWARV